MGKYISVDSLKGALGADLFDSLASQAIDAGGNFLSGKPTTAFANTKALLTNGASQAAGDLAAASTRAVMNNKAVQGVTQMTASALGAAETISSTLNPDTLKKIIKEISTTTVTTISNAATEIATKNVSLLTKKVTNIPKSILSYTNTYFSQNKASLGDILKDMMKGIEKVAEEELDLMLESKESGFISNTKKKIEEISTSIKKFTDKVTPVIDMITSYVGNGPQWIADKLDKEVNGVIYDVNAFCDQKRESLEVMIDDFCLKAGETGGKKLAEFYNNTIVEKAKKQMAKAATLAQKAIVKAKALLQQGLLKLMAITGINIPIPL